MKSSQETNPRFELSAILNKIANCAFPILERSPVGAMALTKLSGSKYLYKTYEQWQIFWWFNTHRSPLTIFELTSNIRLHLLSSVSGTLTAVRTDFIAEAASELSESQWTTGKTVDRMPILKNSRSVGYREAEVNEPRY